MNNQSQLISRKDSYRSQPKSGNDRIAIFEAENGKGSPQRIMEAKKSKEQEELESLKSRTSELEESLRVERLRNRLNEKIIDIAEARWHIEIRKKAGTKR